MGDAKEGWAEWFRGGPPFSAAGARAFDAEELDTNARRLRVILPLLVLAQTLAVMGTRLTPAQRLQADGATVLVHDQAFWVQSAAWVAYAVLTVLVLRGAPSRIPTLAIATGLTFLLQAAGTVWAAQPLGGREGPYLRNLLMTVVLLALPPRAAAGVLGMGLGSLWVGVALGPADGAALRGLLIRSTVATALGAGFAWFLHGARRRDFRLRLTIDEQAAELVALNASLEERIAAQVADLVARNEEVERLNAQLREQVRDRSEALATALRRLAEARPDAEDDLEGTVLGGHFQVEAKLGAGGMGSVYRGTDTRTGERVAIKVVRPSPSAPVALLERFLAEARSAATVDHPAVVRMLHVDIDDGGTLYQVQELVPGRTLEAALGGRPLWPGVAGRVLGVLGEALAAAHEAGVVHRDVKPANVVLTATSPGLRLVDFGISKLHAPLRSDDASTTRTGMVLGTPRYMSPEQRAGRSSVAAPTDVYALGVVAHLLFAGTHPGRAGAPIPDEAADLVVACLSDVPEERPTAADVARRMHAFADGLGAGSLAAHVAAGVLHGPLGGGDEPTRYPDEG